MIYAINYCFRLHVETWFGVEAGAFYDCIIPETIEELWGPIPLGKIDKISYCIAKNRHKIKMLHAKMCNQLYILFMYIYVIEIMWRIAFAVLGIIPA